jgi:hypothetical protein
LLHVAFAAALLGTSTLGYAFSSSRESNGPPALSIVSAKIDRVYDEAESRWKPGGVKGAYRLCDDGPPSDVSHFGLIEIAHTWGTKRFVSLLVRERFTTPSWDVYFRKRECRSIAWSSTIPADLPDAHAYPCYLVSIRARDPGGKWSAPDRRNVRRC